MLRTQKLKSHLLRTQSLKVLPLNFAVGQYIAIHATLTARDFFLAYSYTSGPFTCIFSKNLARFFPWTWTNSDGFFVVVVLFSFFGGLFLFFKTFAGVENSPTEKKIISSLFTDCPSDELRLLSSGLPSLHCRSNWLCLVEGNGAVSTAATLATRGDLRIYCTNSEIFLPFASVERRSRVEKDLSAGGISESALFADCRWDESRCSLFGPAVGSCRRRH